ncbi:MAG: anti-sigma factor [Acidobacteriia bacterium]|nr:anti-sigma factor [Terriglobia bacterium]
MSGHEQFAEDLALCALGVLEGQERVDLEQHLAGCAACRLELEQLRGDGALLALSTTGPKPPQRARQRLLDAVAKEVRFPASPQRARTDGTSVAVTTQRRSWWGVVTWAAVAAVIVFAVSLWVANSALQARLEAQQPQLSEQRAELMFERNLVSTLTATNAMRVTLVSAKAPPQPQGKAFYLRDRSSLVFLANNMPALPAQKAYELWLNPDPGCSDPGGCV